MALTVCKNMNHQFDIKEISNLYQKKAIHQLELNWIAT